MDAIDLRPELVSLDLILRLRSVMPDESPIDLDAHAAMIAYDVERRSPREHQIMRAYAHVEVTREYVQDVRRFLSDKRLAAQA